MFFSPLSSYLQALIITLVVEVGLFALIISRKPAQILAAVSFNVLSHLLLHLYFHFAVVSGWDSRFGIWLTGEIGVWALEGFLYYFSKIIPKISKAALWSFVFNLASIIVGFAFNLVF
jgi:hypothetical protein